MSLVIDLSDRAFALARNGKLLEASASVVRVAGSRHGRPGESMLQQMQLAPTEASSEHWAQIAAADGAAADGATAAGARAHDVLVEAAFSTAHAELRARLDRAGLHSANNVDVIVPASFTARSLSRVLGLLSSLELRVATFRDAAVTAAAALDLPGQLLVVELGLHHIAVTRVSRDGEIFSRNGLRINRQLGGLQGLMQQWLQLAAAAMVLRTRFDPLHDARTEQQLYDALPAALAATARDASARVGVRAPGGDEIEVRLTRDQLALPAQAFIRGTAALLHSLRPAGADATLVLPAVLADLPGVDALLAEFAACELVTIADGYAATALSAALNRGTLPQRAIDPAQAQLLRRFRGPIPLDGTRVTRRRLDVKSRALSPTHLLHEGRAISIPSSRLEVGRAASGMPRVMLPEGLAGVSRLHCSLRRELDQVILVDHSRFGTFVNGERVAGRAVLRAGDRVRVGDPGIELEMIAVGDGNAPPQTN